MNTNNTLINSEEMQVINQLASANIPTDLTKVLSLNNLSNIVNEMSKDFQKAKSIKQEGASAQAALDACLFQWGNASEKNRIARNTANGIELTFEIAEKQSKLILFNTYVSKVMAQQQTIISNQQRELENQNDQLKDNQRELKQNQDTIREHQEKIKEQNDKISRESQEILKLYAHFKEVGLEVGKDININKLIGEIKGFVDNVKNSSAEENRKTKEVLTQKINELQLVISNETDHKLQKFNSHFSDLQKEQKNKLTEVTSECTKRQAELETFKLEQLKQINLRGEEAGQQIKTLQSSLEQTIKQNLTETGKKYSELQVEQKSKLDELAKDFATMQTANENQKNELLQNFDDLKEQHKNNFEELKLAQGEKLATLDEENLKLREQISILTSNEELLKASVAKNKIFSYVGVAAFLLVIYNLLVTYQII